MDVPAADLPFPLPASDAAARVAFVGPAVPFAHAVPGPSAGALDTAFLDPGDAAGLAAFAPETIVAFGSASTAALGDPPVPVLAVIAGTDQVPPGADRTVTLDPYTRAPTPWRCVALPIADDLFRAPVTPDAAPEALFVGPLPDAPEPALARVIADFGLRAALDGAAGDPAQLAVHLPGRRPDGAGSLAPLHVAAGRLLLSGRLDPDFGLLAGVHYVEVRDADELDLRLHQLAQRPEAYDRVRRQGHRAAWRRRASVLWPRLLTDFWRELAAFGTARTPRSA